MDHCDPSAGATGRRTVTVGEELKNLLQGPGEGVVHAGVGPAHRVNPSIFVLSRRRRCCRLLILNTRQQPAVRNVQNLQLQSWTVKVR